MSFDFQFSAAPGGNFPSIMGDPGEETVPGETTPSVDRSELARPRYPGMDRWIPTGYWSGSWGNLVQAVLSGFTANTLYAWPFPSNGGGLIYQMAVEYEQGAGQGAGNFRYGLYAATSLNNIYPGRRIFDSGSFSLTSGNGQKLSTVNKSISAQRVYWAVFCFQGTPAAGTGVRSPSSADSPLGYATTTIASTAGRGLSVAFTYAALPTTFPSGATVSGAAPLTTPPVFIKFRSTT